MDTSATGKKNLIKYCPVLTVRYALEDLRLLLYIQNISTELPLNPRNAAPHYTHLWHLPPDLKAPSALSSPALLAQVVTSAAGSCGFAADMTCAITAQQAQPRYQLPGDSQPF